MRIAYLIDLLIGFEWKKNLTVSRTGHNNGRSLFILTQKNHIISWNLNFPQKYFHALLQYCIEMTSENKFWRIEFRLINKLWSRHEIGKSSVQTVHAKAKRRKLLSLLQQKELIAKWDCKLVYSIDCSFMTSIARAQQTTLLETLELRKKLIFADHRLVAGAFKYIFTGLMAKYKVWYSRCC